MFRARLAQINVPEQLRNLLQIWSGQSTAAPADPDAELLLRHWSTLAHEISRLIPIVSPPPVLFIDELPFLCKNILNRSGAKPAEIERLLGTLREWRGQGMAMALSGSVGMRQFLRQIEVPRIHLSGVFPITLAPMGEDEALAMLRAMARYEDITWWNDDMASSMIDNVVDLTPACLQFAFGRVVSEMTDRDDRSDAHLLTIFRDTIAVEFDREFYQQFDERLHDYSRSEQDIAHMIFAQLAAADAGVTTFADIDDAMVEKLQAQQIDDLDLDDLVSALAEDGFLVDNRETDEIRFADNLVRGWWRSRDNRRARRRRGQGAKKQ